MRRSVLVVICILVVASCGQRRAEDAHPLVRLPAFVAMPDEIDDTPLVDEIGLLPEAAIAAAMRHLFLNEGLVTEGAAAVGAALLLDDPGQKIGNRIAVVISGRNVDMDVFQRVIAGEVPY
jgi:hypothetical protein